MADNHYDAIVVGSGISGGWAAKELTEKGLKVLMLERGRNIEHVKDYVNAMKEAWDFPHRNRPTQAMKAEFPVLMRDYGLAENLEGMWANEQESPYIETKRFDWFRGYHVGGRSLMWGRQSYRFSDLDFEANLKDGIATDWPIRYADIAPWYDHVEKFAGIAGTREGLDVLPDGEFLPPIPLNIVEKDVAARIKKAFGGTRHMIHSRTANITQPMPEQGRVNCQYRNKCILGCPFGAYFSTQAATLPAAMKTGNLTLRPFSIVKEVLYDKDRKRARGVEVIDAETGQTYQYTAKVIFLNASSFNSTWLLMNSATDVWEGGAGLFVRRVGAQRDGPSFRGRRLGPGRGLRRQVLLRPPSLRLLHSAVPQRRGRQARLPARVRLPGRCQPHRMVARDRRAQYRCRSEGGTDRAG